MLFALVVFSLLLQLPNTDDNLSSQRKAIEYLQKQGITVTVNYAIDQVINIIDITVDKDISEYLPSLNAKIIPETVFQATVFKTERLKNGFTNKIIHKVTSVSKVRRDMNLSGAGVKIGIIDSGIDDTHPEFSDRDIICRDYTIDKDCKDYSGHGTHVAGIAAGRTVGVANKAGLTSYKVFKDNQCNLLQLLLALNQAFVDGMNIINLSLTAEGDGLRVLDQVISTITKAGIIVVAANGNDPKGFFKAGYPATSQNAISVASTDNVRVATLYSINDLPYLGKPILFLTKVMSFEKVIGYLPPRTGIVFLNMNPQRAIRFAKSYANAEIVFQCVKDYPTTDPSSHVADLHVVYMLKANCLKLLKITNIEVSVTPEFYQIEIPTKMSYFNSIGPFKTDLKPEISAPGSDVVSAWPNALSQDGNNFRSSSGSSMATPYISGCAALYLQHGGTIFKHVLLNTATLLNNHPIQQGAGFVNMQRLMETKHGVYPYKMINKDQDFTIANEYHKWVMYDIRIGNYKGVNNLEQEVDTPLEYVIEPNFVTVGVNGKGYFSVKMRTNNLFYGGYIQLVPRVITDATPILHIPFIVQ